MLCVIYLENYYSASLYNKWQWWLIRFIDKPDWSLACVYRICPVIYSFNISLQMSLQKSCIPFVLFFSSFCLFLDVKSQLAHIPALAWKQLSWLLHKRLLLRACVGIYCGILQQKLQSSSKVWKWHGQFYCFCLFSIHWKCFHFRSQDEYEIADQNYRNVDQKSINRVKIWYWLS